MTHIVGVIEGYWEFLDKFLRYFHGKEYANGKAKVRARAIIPVHFGINECGREEFLKDLKSFSDYHHGGDSDGSKAKKKFKLLSNFLIKLFPSMKKIDKELDSIKSSDLRAVESKKGNHFICAFYPVGEIQDRFEEGVEIV